MYKDKLGDCLNYALNEEMDGSSDNGMHNNLKTFVIYSALLGYFNDEEILSMLYLVNSIDFVKQVNIKKIDTIMRTIVKAFKRSISFKNMDEFIGKLNDIEVPLWVYDTRSELLELLPNICLFEDKLYYIFEEKDRKYFRCINVNKADDIRSFSRTIFEDFPPFDEEECNKNYTISNMHRNIIGFDKERGILYLNYMYMGRYFAEYHVKTGQEIRHHFQCIGLIDNKTPVVIYKNKIAVLNNNKVRYIRDVDPLEKVSVKNNMIRIEPSLGNHVVFKPFYITTDKKRVEAPYYDAYDFLIDHVRKDLFDSLERLQMYVEDLSRPDSKKRKLTINDISEQLESRREYRKDVKDEYRKLIDFFKNYFGEDEDLLEHFYVLFEASKRLDNNYLFGLYSNHLFEKVFQIKNRNEAQTIMKDVNKFRAELLKDAYWTDELIEEQKSDMYCNNGRVGNFEIVDNRLRTASVALDGAVIVGNQVMTIKNPMEGYVTYNMETGVYDIQYNRNLTKPEIDMILEKFHIFDVAYRVVIDNQLLT